MGKWYIRHEDIKHPSNGVAFFGPFEESELTERLNDRYADLMADGSELDAFWLTDEEVKDMYINTRDYWMTQLAELEKENPAT